MNNNQKVSYIWSRYTNPLRGFTQVQIERMLDNARLGDDIKMQLAFYEIERNTPIFQVCINKRISGIQNRKWDITTIDTSPEATIQQEKVKQLFLESDTLNNDGLTEAIRHLGLAIFRGRSAVKPFFTEGGKLFFKKLQNWNFIEQNNKFLWNPSAEQTFVLMDGTTTQNLQEIPKNEVCYITEEHPVDLPGLGIYLRQLIGEDQWARFIEKQGIPQVILTAPTGTPESDLEKWNRRAIQIFEGGSGCMPNGTTTTVLDGARGQDPFSEYLKHQSELIAILATGGSLNTIGGSTGLGSNLAEIQNDQFNQLINYDCKKIANAISLCAVKKCVEKLFPGQECKVRFSFIEKDDTTIAEYLDFAKKCKEIGITVDIQKLKEVTNLPFISVNDEKDVWQPEATQE